MENNKKSKTIISTTEKLNRKIYGYTLDYSTHYGYMKIGDTINDVKFRIKQQTATASLKVKNVFSRPAVDVYGQPFRDYDVHRYLEVVKKIQKASPNKGFGEEWFFFGEGEEKNAERYVDEYIAAKYEKPKHIKNLDYVLRDEQEEAVKQTYDYIVNNINNKNNKNEFLWNAKPRFGKTLTSYDLIRRLKDLKQNETYYALIVTNRPVISDSWHEDFERFIEHKTKFKFVSEAAEVKNKALSYKEFLKAKKVNKRLDMICFISLQDLKGAEFAGGDFKKLEWMQDIDWDIIVIDEAHEGVDTDKTDIALDALNKKFILHLSGTPFKQLANQKFDNDQIYNWTYIDEQQQKEKWKKENSGEDTGDNPYFKLPVMNIFTYKMSDMITKEVEKGFITKEKQRVDYAFNLGEFFKTKSNGEFEHEEDVKKFLDNLTKPGYPFEFYDKNKKLDHTFWLLSRIDSAVALKKLLEENEYFKNFEIVLATGRTKSKVKAGESEKIELEENEKIENTEKNKRNEKSLEKVRKAIDNNDRTITLSVGQLTTGVTVKEWKAVFMLSDLKSPQTYFQAAFRAQNPYEFIDKDGEQRYKTNSYVFDFAPDRALNLYNKYALSNDKNLTELEKKERMLIMVNYFPVISEDDEGILIELDIEEVLEGPKRYKISRVVETGFVSNALFKNISNVFRNDYLLTTINKLKPLSDLKKDRKKNEEELNDVAEQNRKRRLQMKDKDKIIINKTSEVLGEAIFEEVFDEEQLNEIIKHIKSQQVEDNYRKSFNLTRQEAKNLSQKNVKDLTEVINKAKQERDVNIIKIENDYDAKVIKCEEEEIEYFAETKDKLVEKETESFIKKVNDEKNQILKRNIEEILDSQKKRQEKSEEEKIKDRLKSFTRTIPTFLMAYGNENTNIDNFDKEIDEQTFVELTDITKDDFKKLRDGFEYVDDEGETKFQEGVFDRQVFNGSIKEFINKKEKLKDYRQNYQEDIFDYIPPQKNNQIFTPRWVVELMVQVVKEENPNIFKNKHIKFADLYAKSGMYITEIILQLNEGLKEEIPDDEERIKHIIENQIYIAAPSKILYKIVENYVFDFIKDKNIKYNMIEEDLSKAAQNNTFKEKIEKHWGENMEFDIIIGNPPFQEENKKRNRDDSIYHHFMDASYKLAEKVCYITPARFLFNVGSTPIKWNLKMLNDKHLKVVFYEADSKKIFPDNDIKGGVAVTYRDENQEYEPIETFIAFKELDNIHAKVLEKNGYKQGSIADIMHVQNKFVLEKLYEDYPQFKNRIGSSGNEKRLISSIFTQLPEVFSLSKNDKNNIGIYGRENGNRLIKYINRDYIERNENLEKWKVFVPAANGSGALGEVLSTPLIGQPLIGQPLIGHTQTFISIGSLDTKFEASALLKYIKTKFARVMLGIKKVTQNNKTPETWSKVPLQDFTENSDIDWTKSVKDIDKQLYKKYGLSEEEIQFIEDKVASMD